MHDGTKRENEASSKALLMHEIMARRELRRDIALADHAVTRCCSGRSGGRVGFYFQSSSSLDHVSDPVRAGARERDIR